MISQSLVIGQSYLSGGQGNTLEVDSLIDTAAKAAQSNPEVATEITLAATDALLERCGAQSNALRSSMRQMVHRLCQARDLSLAH